MINVNNANAMAEVIYYLKGIKQEDINKIPKKLMQYLNENASKEHICNFDYNKPLKELDILDEARGIIGMICYNYWCVTEQQKEQYLKKLSMNEQQYQEILHEKYNPDNIFINKQKQQKKSSNTTENNQMQATAIVEYKNDSLFKKVKKFLLIILTIR